MVEIISQNLESYDLEGFSTGTIKCPPRITLDDVVNVQRKLLARQDQMIGFLLISMMNEEFVKKVSNYETSAKIWTCMETYFLSHSRAGIMQYKA